jgi:hypothetical protein
MDDVAARAVDHTERQRVRASAESQVIASKSQSPQD